MRVVKFRFWTGARMLLDVASNMVADEGGDLQQYTGLKDKGGVDIYEGDFLLMVGLKEMVFKVVWQNSHAGLFMQFIDGKHEGAIMPIMKECKVIGNIYETPELIENANE